MKLHELKILHPYLIDVTLGNKTFELRKNDRDYQEGDIIRLKDENTLYRIIDVYNYLEGYGIDTGDCILTFKKLDIKEN